MSRVAKAQIVVPANVDVTINGRLVNIKGKNGNLSHSLHNEVGFQYSENKMTFSSRNNDSNGWIQAGTARSLLNSMIIGVTEGFTRKLLLVGVGYRAVIKGNTVSLFLGYSHTIDHLLPVGVKAECPTPTEIVLESADKQMIGQVAADIRAYRPPESYKGKGVRYSDETIRIKEAKKK